MNYYNSVIQEDLGLIISQSISWEKLKNTTVLVTGVTGMLATYIVYTLHYLNENMHLNVKGILTYRNQENLKYRYGELLNDPNLTFIRQDVTEPIQIECPIDWIIHAAGNASPKYIMSDPVGIIEANVIGTKQMLRLAEEKNVKGFHFLSTREVYGQVLPEIGKIKEEDYGSLNILETRSCYPESKRLAETLIKSFSDQYGIAFTISRIAHSYGPGMKINNDGRIMSDLMFNLINSEDIVLKSKGEAERAFCYIADAVAGIFMILLNGKNGQAYNLANESEPIKIADLAKKMVNMFPEKKLKVVFDIPKRNGVGYAKFSRVALDTSKLESLGWKKTTSLEQGIKKTLLNYG